MLIIDNFNFSSFIYLDIKSQIRATMTSQERDREEGKSLCFDIFNRTFLLFEQVPYLFMLHWALQIT